MQLKKIFSGYVIVATGILPLLFMPWFVDQFGMGKQLLSFGLLAIGMVLWVVTIITNKSATIRFSSWLVWWLLMCVAAVVSLVWTSAGVRERSAFLPWGAGTMLFIGGWLFLVLQAAGAKYFDKLLLAMGASVVVMSISSIIIFLLPVNKLPSFFGAGFAWTGSMISELGFVAVMMVLFGRRVYIRYKKNEGYMLSAVICAIAVVGTFTLIYRLTKSNFPLIDLTSTWVIVLETLKRSPFFGVGSGNYIEGFYAYRPLGFNNTTWWSTAFGYASVGVMQWWTELGIVGLVLLLSGVVMYAKSDRKKRVYWAGWLLMIMAFVLPLHMLTILVFLMFVSLLDTPRLKNLDPKLSLVIAPILVIVTGVGIFAYVAPARAELHYRKSLEAATKNDGLTAYNEQVTTTNLNPLMADYRRAYSQTNLALASVIIQNAGGKALSSEDQQKVAALLQQAVREGKAAIALEPKNPAYWVNLGSIYRGMVGIVDGSADWAIQAFQQATYLDPINPLSKMELGGLLYGTGQLEAADRIFEDAVKVKSNLPNAWYNWAYTKKQLAGKDPARLSGAINLLNQAIVLVDPAGADFEKASKELDMWKAELASLTKKAEPTPPVQLSGEEKLTTPMPIPTVSEEKQVPVKDSQDLKPPVSPVPTE